MLDSQLNQDWIQFLNTQQLSQRTINEYTRYLNSYFSKFVDVTKDNFNKWIANNNNNVARAFIKKLIEFLIEREYFVGEEAYQFQLYKVPKIKGRKGQKEITILSKEEIDLLINSIKKKRVRLMVLTTFYLGLRKEELINLRFKDFNWNKQTVKILGKGNKIRIIPMSNKLTAELISFINEYKPEVAQKCYDENLRFFPRSKSWWDQQLSKAGKKYLGRHINPHLLRHSVSTYLRKQGLDLQKVKEFLGHEKIDTTLKYSHLDRTEVEADIRKVFD